MTKNRLIRCKEWYLTGWVAWGLDKKKADRFGAAEAENMLKSLKKLGMGRGVEIEVDYPIRKRR